MIGMEIKQIDYNTAMRVVVERHYLHRKAPCSVAFGLFFNGTLSGVICYGTPSSAPLRSGICGPEYSHDVIELTRLWIDDLCPKNSESFLIGNTLKRCGKKIVVSYAEKEKGHIGTVYQATNFIYTGLSAKRTNWTVEGLDLHCQTLADKYSADEIRLKYGDKFRLVERSRKHRYVFFNAKKSERKTLLSSLRYKVLPYPKLEMLERWER
jgi:hypothetical protein